MKGDSGKVPGLRLPSPPVGQRSMNFEETWGGTVNAYAPKINEKVVGERRGCILK